MDAIADAKWEGDNQYRHKRYSEAISAYSDALNLCEQHHQSELLHVLYSNRLVSLRTFHQIKLTPTCDHHMTNQRSYMNHQPGRGS